MRYAPILTLGLRHGYWPDGRCRAFGVEPTAATQRLARNHRLVFRRRPDGIDVAGPVDANGGLFVAWSGEASFSFELQLHDSGFSSYTDALPAHPHFASSGGDRALALGSGPEPSRVSFGTIDIRLEPSGSPVATREFHAAFPVRSTRWAYYCVTDLPEAAGPLQVGGAEGAGSLLFDFGRDLADDPDPADPVAARLARDHPGRRRLRFVSEEAVPVRLAPRRVELRLGGHRLTGPLANPDPAYQTTVTLAAGEAPALYQVVMYPPLTPTGG